MLEEGQKAMDFSLPNEKGETISLSGLKGKKVIVYFYPKDDTPGCTKESCSFRDNHGAILDKNAVVLGISADSEKSHTKFIQKFELPFHLLSDTEKTVIKAFGAWGEKKNYGKTYEGILRSTFIIDEEGTVIKTFPKVKPEGHAAEVLEYL
jgi:thioredoxin-dependent peroxiredoxin